MDIMHYMWQRFQFCKLNIQKGLNLFYTMIFVLLHNNVQVNSDIVGTIYFFKNSKQNCKESEIIKPSCIFGRFHVFLHITSFLDTNSNKREREVMFAYQKKETFLRYLVKFCMCYCSLHFIETTSNKNCIQKKQNKANLDTYLIVYIVQHIIVWQLDCFKNAKQQLDGKSYYFNYM